MLPLSNRSIPDTMKKLTLLLTSLLCLAPLAALPANPPKSTALQFAVALGKNLDAQPQPVGSSSSSHERTIPSRA